MTPSKITSISAKLSSSPPQRLKNGDVRPREYLVPEEVERMLKAAGATGRYGLRDRCLILVMYRYGLRAKEASDLLWSQIQLKPGIIHIKRCKKGIDGTRSLGKDELTALRKLRLFGTREYLARGSLYGLIAKTLKDSGSD